MRRMNVPEARILTNYPILTTDDLSAAWAYADAHAEEINAAIAANEDESLSL